MPEQDSQKRLVEPLEAHIALDLRTKGASQKTIAIVLKKRKSWVNDTQGS